MEKRFDNEVFTYDDEYPIRNHKFNYTMRVLLILSILLMLVAYIIQFLEITTMLSLVLILVLFFLFSNQMYLLFFLQLSAYEFRFTLKRHSTALFLILIGQMFQFNFSTDNTYLLAGSILDVLSSCITLLVFLYWAVRWLIALGKH